MKLWTVYSDGTYFWQPTQKDATYVRRKLIGTGIKRSDISVQAVEVPTATRAGLCEWFNERAVSG